MQNQVETKKKRIFFLSHKAKPIFFCKKKNQPSFAKAKPPYIAFFT